LQPLQQISWLWMAKWCHKTGWMERHGGCGWLWHFIRITAKTVGFLHAKWNSFGSVFHGKVGFKLCPIIYQTKVFIVLIQAKKFQSNLPWIVSIQLWQCPMFVWKAISGTIRPNHSNTT
jgi:hypothetical protein